MTLPPLPASLGLLPTVVVAVPAGGQVLYRIVKDPLGPRDFMPPIARPKWRMRDTMLYDAGLSMWETASQAKARMGKPGAIARVELPANAGIFVARTFRSGHCTVWGNPEVLAQHATVV